MTRLVHYRNPLDHVFGALFAPANGDATAQAAAIALDVVETPNAYIVKAEVPGVAKDRIDVKVEDRDVTISFETREELDAEGKTLWRERSYGKAAARSACRNRSTRTPRKRSMSTACCS